LDKDAKGLEASLVVDCAGAALGISDVDCGFLNKLLELLLSGWNVCEKRPEVVLG
jgi:hypothetical protein